MTLKTVLFAKSRLARSLLLMSDMLMLMLQKAHIACTFLNNISEWTIFLFSAVKFILHDVYFTLRILWSFNPENNGQTQGDTIWKNSTEIEVAGG